jgi:hypothetical protein
VLGHQDADSLIRGRLGPADPGWQDMVPTMGKRSDAFGGKEHLSTLCEVRPLLHAVLFLCYFLHLILRLC